MDNFDLKKFLVENKATYNSRLVESDDDFDVKFDEKEYLNTLRKDGRISYDNLKNPSDPKSKYLIDAKILNIDSVKKEIELELEDKQKQKITLETLRPLLKPEIKIEKIDTPELI